MIKWQTHVIVITCDIYLNKLEADKSEDCNQTRVLHMFVFKFHSSTYITNVGNELYKGYIDIHQLQWRFGWHLQIAWHNRYGLNVANMLP